MGNKSTIRKLTRKQIIEFKNNIMVPENSCLVITGNFEGDVNTVLREFEKLPSIKSKIEKSKKMPRNFSKRSEEDVYIEDSGNSVSDVFISFDVEGINFYLLSFISSILGTGNGSKLSLVMREELGYTNEIYSEWDDDKLAIKYSVDNERLTESIENVFHLINEMKFEITTKEYLSSIVFFTENQKKLYDDTNEFNVFLGYDSFIKGRDSDVENVIKQYEAITIEDLESAARRLFKPNNLFVGVTNNKDVLKVSKFKKTLKKCRELLES